MALPPRRRDKQVQEKRVDIGLDIYGKDEKVTGNNLLPVTNEVNRDNSLIVLDEIDKGLINLENIISENYTYELTQEKDLNDFLRKKAVDLLKIQSKAALQLGKIFIEVEEKLGGDNHHNGIYTKWLELNGYNKMTALRHKKRYRLFMQAKTETGKSFLGTTSQAIINEISLKSEMEIKEYISLIDDGIKKDELMQLIKEDYKEIDKKEIGNLNIDNEYKLLNIVLEKISIDKLDNNEKINFEKDIRKVEKILKKYVK